MQILNGLLQNGKGIIVFSPLTQGLLTNRYINGIPSDSRVRTSGIFLKETSLTEEKLKKIRDLNELAKARSESLAQMALAWVLRREEVTVFWSVYQNRHKYSTTLEQ